MSYATTRDLNRVTRPTVRRASADLARPEEMVRGAFQKGVVLFQTARGPKHLSFFSLLSPPTHGNSLQYQDVEQQSW
jgi:hypothetical protein